MCSMWATKLNRKERRKYEDFAKMAVDEVVELGNTWTERYNQYKMDYENESPIVQGFAEVFSEDDSEEWCIPSPTKQSPSDICKAVDKE